MVFLCLCWGFNQVAVKLTLAEIPPLTQAWTRFVDRRLIIWIYARYARISLDFRGETLKAGASCRLSCSAWNSSSSYRGLLFTTASRATLFIYVAPFVVVAGLSHFLVPNDRFRWSQWAGLLMSFAGLLLAFGAPTPSANAINYWRPACAGGLHCVWSHDAGGEIDHPCAHGAGEDPAYQLVISAPMRGRIRMAVRRDHHSQCRAVWP